MPFAADGSISSQRIQDALEHVLGSRDFRSSERKRRFLQFIVQETLAGRADRIKAYAVALAVFDRDASFDPLTDPLVRIEAGRLRRCLERYYLTEGAEDPVRITIPKGSYVPEFSVLQEAEPDTPEPTREDRPRAADVVEAVPVKAADGPPVEVPIPSGSPLRSLRLHLRGTPRLWAAMLALSLVPLIALWLVPVVRAPIVGWISGDERATAVYGPSLMVLPFANATGDPAQDVFVEGFTEEVISGLMRFKNVLVFGADTSFRYRTAPALHDAVPDVNIDYILKGSVSQVGGQVEIGAALLRAKNHQYLWSDSFRREFSPGKLIDLRQDIAAQVARVLAQPHGVISGEVLRSSAGQPPETLSSYECVLWTRQYWRLPGADLHKRSRTCLERAVQNDPHYADAWAALALIYIDEDRLGLNPNSARPDPVGTALQLARHAAELAPDTPLPHQALGLAHWLRREAPQSIAAYERALALNPHDSDILADLGRSYSFVGNWEKGIPLLQEAFARNPAQPSWYRIILVLFHYVHGRYDEALVEAWRIDRPDIVYPHVALAMIYGQTGRRDEAAREINEILRLYPTFGEKAVFEFQRRNIDPAIIAKIIDGLTKAGLYIPPNRAFPP
ncbi:MAG TPA: tetratricopeptide repeat protein [Azospirillum sp.]|nr:tetratricopeptide repeat protein [Azospirillum sp.]